MWKRSIFSYISNYYCLSLFFSCFLIISLFFHFVRLRRKRKRKDQAILPSLYSVHLQSIVITSQAGQYQAGCFFISKKCCLPRRNPSSFSPVYLILLLPYAGIHSIAGVGMYPLSICRPQ